MPPFGLLIFPAAWKHIDLHPTTTAGAGPGLSTLKHALIKINGGDNQNKQPGEERAKTADKQFYTQSSKQQTLK